jgi:hypothetical protein
VIPNTTPPEGVDNGRWIEVKLEEQTMAVYDYDQNHLVFAAIAATGQDGSWTQPGLFQIYLAWFIPDLFEEGNRGYAGRFHRRSIGLLLFGRCPLDDVF